MKNVKTLLIANRGEIAVGSPSFIAAPYETAANAKGKVRINRTAKALGLKTISIYSSADADSEHVHAADEAISLPGNDSTAYTDGDTIIQLARDSKADAIIPGYGFLSENADFARAVAKAGIRWVGPSPEVIESFGVKHGARGLAEKANVPIVPGTKELVKDEAAAVAEAEKLGFPVMLKATGGGGGMGLVTCHSTDEVRRGFQTATSRGQTLFKNPGVFLEKFYPQARHVEIQVFGNGQGKAIHFGERECSIQRRHQKVIEECPSPFVVRYGGLRDAITAGAVSLAESVKYASAGTVELLVDNESGGIYFLEMNTRLQVEHGVTELCYGVDLVNLMLQQADEPLSSDYLADIQATHNTPVGHAIEARIYAENPIRDHAPSPGLLMKVEWPEGARVDTWVSTGTTISPNYDPLIAKVMCHREVREAAMEDLVKFLETSVLCGPPTNKDHVCAILKDAEIKKGNTLTAFIQSFKYSPPAIDVISGGAYTLIQDLPARPHVGRGIPMSGPMDPVAFQIANALVGNALGKEALEFTLNGPELLFLGPASVALAGATMLATLDGKPLPMWQQVRVKAGQRVKIGKTKDHGCRAYLAVYGGFTNIAEYFNSKSTSPLVALGGYQGRALATGDLLSITTDHDSTIVKEGASLPENLRPQYQNEWKVLAMPGPHDIGYLSSDNIEMVYSTTWKVSHNAARSGIRLIGPVPRWARPDGGDGGAHPSNVIEYGYPLATLNWTGDDPCIFPVDCPNFGGFISSTTVPKADWMKLGQLKAGDTLKYVRCSLAEALEARRMVDSYIDNIEKAAQGSRDFSNIPPLDTLSPVESHTEADYGTSIIATIPESNSQPHVTYRQGGDSNLLIDYGYGSFDLNHRVRVSALENLILNKTSSFTLPEPHNTSQKTSVSNAFTTAEAITPHITITVGACTSLLITYDPLALPREKLLAHLQTLERTALGDLSAVTLPTRLFHLPITFQSKEQKAATERYMQTQRPHAPYLPDNLSFVARNNAFSASHLKQVFTTGIFMAVVVGFYSGNTVSLPVDPRQRMSSPKMNPSRVFTPAGTVGWGGGCFSIYPVDSPGGYQMLGRTIPTFDAFGRKAGFVPGPADEKGGAAEKLDAALKGEVRPWLFEPTDLIRFYEVTSEELDRDLRDFRAGKYQWKVESTSFSMAEHNALLRETAEEVRGLREKQREAQTEMMRAEEESLKRWREEREKEKPAGDEVERLLGEEGVVAVEAPVDANVWKVLVQEHGTGSSGVGEAEAEAEAKKDVVRKGDEVIVLEAMKLEVAVRYGVAEGEEDVPQTTVPEARVERVLVKPGETVKAGQRVCLVRAVS